jgi:hypothetical protein
LRSRLPPTLPGLSGGKAGTSCARVGVSAIFLDMVSDSLE